MSPYNPAKYLGVLVDNKLTWRDQIFRTADKASKMVQVQVQTHLFRKRHVTFMYYPKAPCKARAGMQLTSQKYLVFMLADQ
ncbi:hypothetical protein J6590_028183 [Homalodisca vitripennis]|nr:hypothetical protein J6590_028183 [Homalodisca vitripennis]